MYHGLFFNRSCPLLEQQVPFTFHHNVSLLATLHTYLHFVGCNKTYVFRFCWYRSTTFFIHFTGEKHVFDNRGVLIQIKDKVNRGIEISRWDKNSDGRFEKLSLWKNSATLCFFSAKTKKYHMQHAEEVITLVIFWHTHLRLVYQIHLVLVQNHSLLSRIA